MSNILYLINRKIYLPLQQYIHKLKRLLGNDKNIISLGAS